MKDNITNTIDRANFFQTVHAWPLSEKLDFNGWLSNFDGDDKEIASYILDFFIYYPNCMIEQMLTVSVGKAGANLIDFFPSWKHLDFKEKCLYSFIPGETQSPTDSGHIFTRILRDKLGIPERRIINYDKISEALNFAHQPTVIILVDDFVGSGAQCDEAWNRHKVDGKTLKEITFSSDHKFIYAPLIINKLGFDRINSVCDGLILSPAHVLTKEYNLFDPSCFCWKGEIGLYNKGIEMILRKSNELGIPFTNGNSVRDVKGFGEQGLALAFEHGAPDAIPPIFYWCDNNWTPLIQKRYAR